LGELIRNKGKIETNFDLWKRCKIGDKDALTEMERYNKEDVALLEETYLFLRPWIKNHPNVGLLMDANEPCCPNCGSFNIEITDSYYTTPANQYKAVRCGDCGAPNRLPESIVGTLEKKKLLRSIAR
jgi:RNase P subunit RPR2